MQHFILRRDNTIIEPRTSFSPRTNSPLLLFQAFLLAFLSAFLLLNRLDLLYFRCLSFTLILLSFFYLFTEKIVAVRVSHGTRVIFSCYMFCVCVSCTSACFRLCARACIYNIYMDKITLFFIFFFLLSLHFIPGYDENDRHEIE